MAIDHPRFAQECVRQGAFFEVNPHYLLGVSQLRSKISDDSEGDRIGPFRLKQTEWDANSNTDEFDVHFTAAQISDPMRQCTVFALMTHRAFDAFMSTAGRSPSAKELFMRQFPDAENATFAADFQKALDDTADLIREAAAALLDDPASVGPIISDPDQVPTGPVPPDGPEGAPEWYKLAVDEIGTRDDGHGGGPAIARYRALAQCGEDGDAWCAIFANAMFALCNPPLPGTRSPAARSFSSNSNFVELAGPALGAVTVFWRDNLQSGLGHVGFYRGETSHSVYVLGGNEGHMVQIDPQSKSRLIGYLWPRSVRMPAIATIAIQPGTTVTS